MASKVPLSSCLLFLLAPAVCMATPAPREPVTACAAMQQAAEFPVSDIDYPAINQLLLTSDPQQRLMGLPVEIRKLGLSQAPEAGLVRDRLKLALAQTQVGQGMKAAATATLKSLPVSSAQAPEALLLLAELEVENGHRRAAIRWLQQMAELFPDEVLTIKALWRAAELNHPYSRQAIALWQQAATQADEALASAQAWQARSREPDFLDKVNNEKLSPELWRLARSTLTDPAFAGADALQSESRRQLQCLTANQNAQLRRMEKNPRLLADLSDTVESLGTQLQMARNDVARREGEYLTTAQQLKDCEARHADCAELTALRDTQGRELTGWRNRIQNLEKKLAFLRQQESSLKNAGAVNSSTEVATQLTDRLSNSRVFMQSMLQQSLADAVQNWEALSAEAHYRLAEAQEPRIHPGLIPPR